MISNKSNLNSLSKLYKAITFSKLLFGLKMCLILSDCIDHQYPKSRQYPTLMKYDSRDLWKNFNYKDLGLIGEPYFDPAESGMVQRSVSGTKSTQR